MMGQLHGLMTVIVTFFLQMCNDSLLVGDVLVVACDVRLMKKTITAGEL